MCALKFQNDSSQDLRQLDRDEDALMKDISSIDDTLRGEPLGTGAISWNSLRTAVLGIIALVAATVITGAMVIVAYLVVTHTLTPKRLHYVMPVPLELEGHDLKTNISLFSIDQYYVDSQIQSAELRESLTGTVAKPLISSGQMIDIWLDIDVPGEYERQDVSRKFAHVVAELQSHKGVLRARATKPVVLNGRPSSALCVSKIQVGCV